MSQGDVRVALAPRAIERPSVGSQAATRSSAGDDTSEDGPIKSRLVAMLAMRRERRRRVQLPLLVASALLMAAGFVLFVAGVSTGGGGITFRWAYSPIFLGAAIIAIAAMPGDIALLRALCCFVTIMSVYTCVVQLQTTFFHLQLAFGTGDGLSTSERAQRVSLALGYAGTIFIVTPTMGIGLLSLLVGSYCGVGKLQLSSLVLKVVSWGYLGQSVVYALFVSAFRLHNADEQVFFPDSRAGRVELLACYLLLCVQCAAMGLAGVLKRDLRAHIHGWLAMRGVGVGAAAGVAEMLDGVKAAHVLERASKSFRAVSLDDLSFEHLLNSTRVPVVNRSGAGTPMSQLRRGVVTRPAQKAASAGADAARLAELGHVDAFVSHSWHDPPRAKWEALQAWGAAFKLQHGRPPLLWLDKVSIDQANIAAELPLLPVHLAGCRTLLVLHGPSYLRRLWCVVELFIFFQVHLPAPPRERIQFVLLKGDFPAYSSTDGRRRHRRISGQMPASRAAAPIEPIEPHSHPSALQERSLEEGLAQRKPTWTYHAALEDAERFDVRDAAASLASDEERLLAVIEGSGEAVELFSQWIRSIVVSKLKEAYATDGRPLRLGARKPSRSRRVTPTEAARAG